MPKMITPLLVWLDTTPDDRPLEISSDQRDLAAWEASDDYRPHAAHLMTRFVAWSALARASLYTAGWKRFKTECVEVESLVKADEQEGEQGLDPGRSTPSAMD